MLLVHAFPHVFPFGWMGVQLFFVLSGFLITGILFDTRADRHRFRNFYARRSLRIFPLYYGFLAVLSLAGLLLHARWLKVYLLWFVYLQNFFWLVDGGQHTDLIVIASGRVIAAIGHLWSLALEEQFYLVWPLAVFAVKSRVRLMQLCAVGVALRVLLAILWQHTLSPETLALGITYRMLPTQCDGFLMGALLALWVRGTPNPRPQRLAGRLAACTLVAFAVLLLTLHRIPALTGGDVFDYRSGFQATIGLPLTNLTALAIIFAVLQPGSWLYRLCHLAPMRSLGRVSYGIYVYHLPVLVLLFEPLSRHARHHHLPATATGLLASVSATVAIAYASFYLYEKPFLLLKDRFTAQRSLPRGANRAPGHGPVSQPAGGSRQQG